MALFGNEDDAAETAEGGTPDDEQTVGETPPDAETFTTAVAGGTAAAPKPRGGRYTLQPGDTPGTLAVELLGHPNRARELVQANKGSDWKPGTEITVPGGSR